MSFIDKALQTGLKARKKLDLAKARQEGRVYQTDIILYGREKATARLKAKQKLRRKELKRLENPREISTTRKRRKKQSNINNDFVIIGGKAYRVEQPKTRTKKKRKTQPKRRTQKTRKTKNPLAHVWDDLSI